MFTLLALELTALAMPAISTTHETPWQLVPTVTRVDSVGQIHTRRKRRQPVTIHHTLIPQHPGLDIPDAPFVACRAVFAWNAQAWTPHVSGCSGAFLEATQAAVDRWALEAPAGLHNATVSATIVFTNKLHHEAVHVAVDSEAIPSDGSPWFVAHDYPHQPHRYALRYPDQASSLRLPEQVCEIDMTIDTRGRPSDVQVGGCHAAFRASLADDLKHWRYHPYIVDGRATSVPVSIPVRFKRRS